MRRSVYAVAGAALVAAAPIARAQNAAPPPAAPPVLDTGTVAPDFTLTGATRFGVLRDPVRLSGFRGRTVVLAFFVRARTKG